jgi:hypothetical protein
MKQQATKQENTTTKSISRDSATLRREGNVFFTEKKFTEAKRCYRKSLSAAMRSESSLDAILALNNLLLITLRSDSANSLELSQYHTLLMNNMNLAYQKGELPNEKRMKALHRCSQAFERMDANTQKKVMNKYGDSNYDPSITATVKLSYYHDVGKGVGLCLGKKSRTLEEHDYISSYFGKQLDPNNCYLHKGVNMRYEAPYANQYISPDVNGYKTVGYPITPTWVYAAQLCNDGTLNEPTVNEAYQRFCGSLEEKDLLYFFAVYYKNLKRMNNAVICLDPTRIESSTTGSELCVSATRKISPGEKIYVPYGADYWATFQVYQLRARGEVVSSNKALVALHRVTGQKFDLSLFANPGVNFSDMGVKTHVDSLVSMLNLFVNHQDGGESSYEALCGKVATLDRVNALVNLFLFSGVAQFDGLIEYSFNIRQSNVAGINTLKKNSSSYMYISNLVKKLSSTAIGQETKDNIFKICVYLILANELPKQTAFPSHLFMNFAQDELFKIDLKMKDANQKCERITECGRLKEYIQAPSA